MELLCLPQRSDLLSTCVSFQISCFCLGYLQPTPWEICLPNSVILMPFKSSVSGKPRALNPSISWSISKSLLKPHPVGLEKLWENSKKSQQEFRVPVMKSRSMPSMLVYAKDFTHQSPPLRCQSNYGFELAACRENHSVSVLTVVSRLEPCGFSPTLASFRGFRVGGSSLVQMQIRLWVMHLGTP